MPYTNNYRYVSNTRISNRLKQVMVLALTVLVGILISVSINA